MSSAKLVKQANKASPAQIKAKVEKSYPSLKVALKGESQASISIYQTKSLPSELREWIFHLFETNMKAMYKADPSGYSSSEKKAELFDPASRFVVLRDTTPLATLIGYSIFRFDTEETIDGPDARVIYCYEVQVESEQAQRGAGKVLMELLASIGKDWEMEKVMLTVFKSNEKALAFYKKIGYGIDGISPSKCGDDSETYEILSKAIQ